MKNLLAALTLTLSLTVTAQSYNEMDPLSPSREDFTIIFAGAECGCSGCYYFFSNARTGKEINLSWNEEWDEHNGTTFPNLDNESATIMRLISNCPNARTECSKVINKEFAVNVVRKRREEYRRLSPELWEKTGKMETYLEITKIRYK